MTDVESIDSKPTEAPKTGISRHQIDKVAKEAKEKRELPEVPGKKPTFEQLEEWLKLLTEDMWSHICIYVYRTFPVINRKLSDIDNNNYIDVVTKEQLDKGLRDYLINVHGGGKYKFLVNDVDKRSGNLMEGYMSIPIDEVMPKLNYKELDWADRNNMGFKNLLVSQGIMDSKGNLMATPAQQQAQANNPADLVGAVGGMYKEFMGQYNKLQSDQQATILKLLGNNESSSSKGITDLMLERMKQDDPNKQMAMMQGLMQTMMTMMKDSKPATESMTFKDMLMLLQQSQQQAQAQMQQQLDMFKLMMENNKPAQAPDGFETLIKARQAFPEMFGRSTGHAPEKTTAEVVLDGIKEIGVPVIGLVSQFMQQKTGVAPIVPTNPQQAQELVNQAGMGQTGPSNPQSNVVEMPQQLPPPSPQSTGQGIPPDSPTFSQIVFKNLMQFGGAIANAIRSGATGDEVGAQIQSMTPMLGMDVYILIKNQGKERIIGTMKAIPEFWNQTGQVQGEEYMEQFVEDFINMEEIMKQGMEGNEPAS